MPRDLRVGVSDKVWNAAKAFGLALAGGDRFPNLNDWNDVVIKRHSFYHRIDIASIVANTPLQFFNVAPSEFVSNLPQPKAIGGDAIFFLMSPRWKVERGYNVAGAAQANAEWAQYSNVAFDQDANSCAGDIAALYEHGLIQLRIGGYDVLKDQYGGYKLPIGGGAQADGWAHESGTNAATVGGSFSNVNNGIPASSNGYAMAPFFAMGPVDQIECTIKYNFARTLAAALVGRMELDGYLISSN